MHLQRVFVSLYALFLTLIQTIEHTNYLTENLSIFAVFFRSKTAMFSYYFERNDAPRSPFATQEEVIALQNRTKIVDAPKTTFKHKLFSKTEGQKRSYSGDENHIQECI